MVELTRIERPCIFVTRRLLPAVEERMAQLFDATFNADDLPMDRSKLTEAMANCDVLVPTVTDNIDAELIATAPPRLKLIASYGAGVNHIDLAAAKAKGIMVTNTPGVFTDDTADLTMAMILNVPRRLGEGHRLMRSGEWSGWTPTGMLGHRIGGKTLGIIGFGRIGEAVAARAKAFGLNVVYNKRNRLPASVEAELGVAFEPDLDRLVSRADIISLHCPLTAETEKLINAERIAMMKPDAYIINSSRGELIDEDALIEALKAGRIGGAGLDVYTHEPAIDPRWFEIGQPVCAGQISGQRHRVWLDVRQQPGAPVFVGNHRRH